jgi:6-oxo-cyclohex-1-ene-carbonyl-CoA hydrolase
MACDFTVAGDHARFGQAGPIHGSAPDGGSTDFLDLYVGYAKAAESLVLCEQWSAYKALRLGLVNDVAPVYRGGDGAFMPNPLVVTDRYVDQGGRIVFGEMKVGEARAEAEALIARCTVDLSRLDEMVNRLASKLLYAFPDCVRKTLESLRKKKLEHWYANSESNRSWLALNMATEAAAGFPAFHYGGGKEREIDFVLLRRRLAEGRPFDAALVREVLPASARAKMPAPEPDLAPAGAS